MTGFECLKEELKNRGMSKGQIESKVVPVVLDILANSGTKYQDFSELESEVAELEKRKKILLLDVNTAAEIGRRLSTENYRLKKECEEREDKAVTEEGKTILNALNKFYETLNSCETPEGRDMVRRAQMFASSVKPESSYERYAYTLSLGAILSGGTLAGIGENGKINENIPFPDDYTGPRKRGKRR